jgi:tight adherence protein C
MTAEILLAFAAFGVVASLVMLLALVFSGERNPVATRLAESPAAADRRARRSPPGAPGGAGTLPQLGKVLMPEDANRLNRLKSRLMQAGMYQRHSTAIYMGIKMVMMLTPLVVGVGMSFLGLISLRWGVILGASIGLVGNVAPGVWLRHQKSGRQRSIRRALPDALDVIIVCLEGGLSLPASFDRVTSELKAAHPLLASELAIVRREIQLGRSTGEALRQFADRFDAEELRSLASVVIQAERFGASVVKALRVHADALRIRRHQYAEAQAQKAPVKLIFPTVLCIFPALYIILMGPAGIMVFSMFKDF